MAERDHSASIRAAEGVEQIIAAAQGAADAIIEEAEVEREAAREKTRRDAGRVLQKARDQGETELNDARRSAVKLGQDAQREAEETISNARREAAAISEETRRSVQGRVAAAEKSAAQVLSEAEALSGGLRQLAQALEGQASRILHDVQAAHRRMQADLRVESGSDLRTRRAEGSSGGSAERDGGSGRRAASARSRGDSSDDGGERASSRRSGRANPFDDLERPGWSRD